MGRLDKIFEGTKENKFKRLVAAPVLATAALNILGASQSDALMGTEYTCDMSAMHFDDVSKRTMARACMAINQDGTTIVVGFGVDMQDVTAMTDMANGTIADATDGVDRFTFVPVQASDEALADYQLTNVGCATAEPADDNRAAMIADRFMNISADHVIAVVNESNCNDKDNYGKNSKVKDESKDDHEPPKTNGIMWSDSKRNAQMYRFSQQIKNDGLDAAAQVLIHERLHLDELGHAGIYTSGDLHKRYIGSIAFPMIEDAEISLSRLVNRPYGNYDETGALANIMGGRFPLTQPRLNAVQRRRLDWPTIALGGREDNLINISPFTHVMDDLTSDNHSFASFRFDTPIRFHNQNMPEPDPVVAYNELVFDPYVDDDGAIPGLVEVYLLTDMQHSVQTVSLGYLDLRQQDTSSHVFTFGAQQVWIQRKGSGLEVWSSSLPMVPARTITPEPVG